MLILLQNIECFLAKAMALEAAMSSKGEVKTKRLQKYFSWISKYHSTCYEGCRGQYVAGDYQLQILILLNSQFQQNSHTFEWFLQIPFLKKASPPYANDIFSTFNGPFP